MKLNPKVTGALAWTGLVLVLAVPAADMLGGKPEASVHLTSDTDQVKSASVTPTTNPVPKPVAVTPSTPKVASVPAVASSDPVKDFVKSGKKLPSYISGNDTPVEDVASVAPTKPLKPGTITVNPDGTISRPAPALSPTTPSETVATIKPNLVAPIPLPASARPRPQVQTATLPAAEEKPLIIEDEQVALRDAVEPLLDPATPSIDPDNQPIISGDQLEEWDSGSLADYLRRKGLMENASSATVNRDSNYDPDGFFLDEGPNRDRRSRVIIIDRGDRYY